MHDFFIYNGATDIEDGCGFAAGDVVVKLCQTLTRFNEHLIFFNNYFNFIELSQKLRYQGFFHVARLGEIDYEACLLSRILS